MDPKDYPHEQGVRQVVMIEPVWERFVADMRSRGLDVARIPSGEDGIPTYAVTPRLD